MHMMLNAFARFRFRELSIMGRNQTAFPKSERSSHDVMMGHRTKHQLYSAAIIFLIMLYFKDTVTFCVSVSGGLCLRPTPA